MASEVEYSWDRLELPVTKLLITGRENTSPVGIPLFSVHSLTKVWVGSWEADLAGGIMEK